MTHTDLALRGLLADVCEHPDDDGPRLVYADRCEELGQEERAEFVRVQVAKADLSYRLQYRVDKHGWRHLFGVGQVLDDLILNYKDKTEQYPGYSWGSSPSPTGPGLYKCEAAEVWIEQKPLFKLTARRGFVGRVACSASVWLQHADALLAAQPITEVELTTWPRTELLALRSTYRLVGRAKEVLWSYDPDDYNMGPIVLALLKAEWPRVKKWSLPTVTDVNWWGHSVAPGHTMSFGVFDGRTLNNGDTLSVTPKLEVD